MSEPEPNAQYQTQCPHCSGTLKCQQKHFGKRIKCPKCGHEFRIPILVTPPPPPPIAATPITPPIDRYSRPTQNEPKPETFSFLTEKPSKRTMPKAKATRSSMFVRVLIGVYLFFLALMLLGTFGMTIENTSDSPLRDPGRAVVSIVFGPILLTGMLVLYVVPSVVAYVRDHQNLMPILILNLFFGWTLLGWVICLAWSFTSDVKESRQYIRTVTVKEENATEL